MNEIHDEQPPTVTDNQNAAGAENREFRIAGAEAENIADAQLVHDADRRKSVAMALVEALESLRVFGGFDRQALRASVTGPCSMSAVDSFLRARLADGTLRRLLDGIYAFSSHEQTHRPPTKQNI